MVMALGPFSSAMAQSTDDASDGIPWALTAVVGLALAGVAVVTITLIRWRRVTSIGDRLPDAPPEPEVRQPIDEKPPLVGAARPAAPEVLSLLDNPAVAPPPGGAADLTPDPWS